jgi:hypothetical protein
MLRLVISIAAAATLVVGAATARADKCDEQAETAKKGGKNFHIEYRNGQKIHVIDTVVSVCGKVPRPSVAYVLTAKSINYEWETLKQDFLPLILATVKKNPF